MNRRQVILLVTIVGLLHAGLLWGLLGTKRQTNRVVPQPKARPNFFARESKWLDEDTGAVIVYREFRVSTRLAETGQENKPKTEEAGKLPAFAPAATHTP